MQRCFEQFSTSKMHIPLKSCTKNMKFVKNCKTFAFAGVLALLLTGCGSTTKEMTAEVGKALETNLARDFAELKFEEHSYSRGMNPTVTFSGRTSTILVQEKPELDAHSFMADDVRLTGLAITKSGRYFKFTYQSPLLAQDLLPFFSRPCVEDGCRYFRYTGSISRSEAMNWFFYSDAFTPERFKELFDEEAPPKRVEA